MITESVDTAAFRVVAQSAVVTFLSEFLVKATMSCITYGV